MFCVCPVPKVKVKGEIMYFLVNASPPKPLDLATSNFADAFVRSKGGFCDGVSKIFSSTEGLITLGLGK